MNWRSSDAASGRYPTPEPSGAPGLEAAPGSSRIRSDGQDETGGSRPDPRYAYRPFVLCGLPVKRPPAGTLIHERRNGRFLLQVTGHPNHGLPWGQDRLVPIFLATLATRQQSATVRFPSAAEMLDTFGIGQGGTQYRRLVAAFERIFGATIFFGTDSQQETASVFQQVRFNFMSEARLWYWRNGDQQALPEVGENVVILSPEFYREIIEHPIPTDLQAARALSGSPAALDLYNWLTYRCHVAKREERVPLFGAFGLTAQLGIAEYARPRKFRERLERKRQTNPGISCGTWTSSPV